MAEPRKAPAKKTVARKPAVTASQRAKILAAIKDGLEPERAALASGVRADVFAALIKTGFADDVDQALAETELRLVRLLRDKDQAASARWTLERLFPTRWSRPSVVQHVPGGAGAKPANEPEADAQPAPADGGEPSGGVVTKKSLAQMRAEREARERDAARSAAGQAGAALDA